jgi:hypothetical protein
MAPGAVAVSRANLLNAGLFQITWFACVLGGPSGSLLWGLAAVTGLIWFSARSRTLSADLALAGVAAVFGFGLDTLWIKLGVLDYNGAGFAPPWIVLLWIGVAFSVNHSLSLFQQRPLLGGLLAAACAPLSYLGGERLGGVLVPDPWLLVPVACVWFVVFAIGFRVAGPISRLTRQSAARRHVSEENS